MAFLEIHLRNADLNELKGVKEKLLKRMEARLTKLAESGVERMQANVSGPKPYGTGEGRPPIVRRGGTIYETIGYEKTRLGDGFIFSVGAVKGSLEGRLRARVHDEGETITAKNAKSLVFPPFGSRVARNSSGLQFQTFQEAVENSYSWYMSKRKTAAMFVSHKGARPKLGFVFKKSVKIPARGIISRVGPFLERGAEKIAKDLASQSFLVRG